MLSVELRGDQQLITRLTALPEELRISLGRVVTRLAIELERNVKVKLSGSVLHVRTGHLRASIHATPAQFTGDSVTATVGTNLVYAAIQEFGGTIKHPGGTPYEIIEGRGAVWVSLKDAKAEFLPKTRPHPIHIPARSFLRSALAEMAPRIRAEIDAAIKQTVAARG